MSRPGYLWFGSGPLVFVSYFDFLAAHAIPHSLRPLGGFLPNRDFLYHPRRLLDYRHLFGLVDFDGAFFEGSARSLGCLNNRPAPLDRHSLAGQRDLSLNRCFHHVAPYPRSAAVDGALANLDFLLCKRNDLLATG